MKKNTTRRDFLRGAAATIPLTLLSSPLAVRAAEATAAAAKPSYQPQFFQPAEWRLLEAVVDRLIPADALGPGAIAAGVPEFIDRQMESPYGHGQLWYMSGPFHADAPAEFGHQSRLTPRDIYRVGLAALDRYCQGLHGNHFADLASAVQETLLQALESGELPLPGLAAKTLFGQLLGHTREGFFADPMYGGNRDMIGWKFAGFPGARADFLDWVDFPNTAYPLGPVSLAGRRS